jgi:hypothetical protein
VPPVLLIPLLMRPTLSESSKFPTPSFVPVPLVGTPLCPARVPARKNSGTLPCAQQSPGSVPARNRQPRGRGQTRELKFLKNRARREMREPEWQATRTGSPALCCSGDDRLCLSPAVRVSKAPRTRVQLLCAPRDVSKSSPDANPSESSPCPVRPGEHILPVLSVRVSREGTYFSQTSSTDPKEQVRVRVRLVLCTRALCVAFCWFVRRQSMILALICRANTPRQYLC